LQKFAATPTSDNNFLDISWRLAGFLVVVSVVACMFLLVVDPPTSIRAPASMRAGDAADPCELVLHEAIRIDGRVVHYLVFVDAAGIPQPVWVCDTTLQNNGLQSVTPVVDTRQIE